MYSAPKELSMDRIESELKPDELSSERNCYVCKAEFTTLHHFYDSMCKPCGDLNYRKRFQTASLHGKVALITGSRLKIGRSSPNFFKVMHHQRASIDFAGLSVAILVLFFLDVD